MVKHNLYARNNPLRGNMCPQAQLAGLYPRSEELIELTRRYDRGQADWSQVRRLFDNETRHIIQLQQKAGFEYFTDGALSWQDPLRPLTLALGGVKSGTRYSRWFDTNTFYQKPVVIGEVSLGTSPVQDFIQGEFLPNTGRWKIVLPGPYTFSELSENKHYVNKEDLVLAIAKAERELILRLAKAGVSLVQLSEPCLVYRPYREDPPSAGEIENALGALRLLSQNSPAKVSVQTFFGDASPLLPKLLQLPVEGIGFDLYETDYSKLQVETSKKIILGIVDSRESRVEEPEWIAQTAELVGKRLKASDWVLSPNTDLKYLPQSVADAKTAALAEAVRISKGED